MDRNKQFQATGSFQSSFRPKIMSLKTEDVDFKRESTLTPMKLDFVKRWDKFEVSQQQIKRRRDLEETINSIRVKEWLKKHQLGPIKPPIQEIEARPSSYGMQIINLNNRRDSIALMSVKEESRDLKARKLFERRNRHTEYFSQKRKQRYCTFFEQKEERQFRFASPKEHVIRVDLQAKIANSLALQTASRPLTVSPMASFAFSDRQKILNNDLKEYSTTGDRVFHTVY